MFQATKAANINSRANVVFGSAPTTDLLLCARARWGDFNARALVGERASARASSCRAGIETIGSGDKRLGHSAVKRRDFSYLGTC
jgi:hypothetical protein